MHLNKNHRRHMYIKTSPLRVVDNAGFAYYCYRYGHLENVKALIDMVPPTKVLSSSADSFSSANPPGCGLGRTGELFLHTCLLEKIMKCISWFNLLIPMLFTNLPIICNIFLQINICALARDTCNSLRFVFYAILYNKTYDCNCRLWNGESTER